MLSIGDAYFYFDLKRIDELVSSEDSLQAKEMVDEEIIEKLDSEGKVIETSRITKKYTKGKEIDGSKYDTIRFMMEILINYSDDEGDDTLGFEHMMNKAPISFKLAFNTLVKEGILKEMEVR